ncbi:MAG: hypothetical protein NW214_12430 [Pseudanabaenaceae cyanobacterium bins.39]|nr:hypothetical protein [Pseudanabaenaceae cyanobacterium bins.39]
MATPHRTKQISLRLPLPLLSLVKSEADANQQAIADWILTAISRELEPQTSTDLVTEPQLSPSLMEQLEGFVSNYINQNIHQSLHEYLQQNIGQYLGQPNQQSGDQNIRNALEPMQQEIGELRTRLGECRA